jgi:hypothetical protein
MSAIFRESATARQTGRDDLNELMQVTSPRSWLLLAALAILLAAAVVWSTVTTVTTSVSGLGAVVRSGNSHIQEAVVFVPLDRVPSLHPGMEADVSVVGGPSLRMIAATPADPSAGAAARRIAGSTPFLRSYVYGSGYVPVPLIMRMPPRGYLQPSPGAMVQARIVVSSQRLISLVAP